MPLPPLSKKAKELKARADEAFVQGKWKKALDFYTQFDNEAPGDVRIQQRVGDLFKRLGQSERAIETYKQVASLYAGQGFWAKAIAINKIILELDPRDLSVQKQLARMYSTQKKPDKEESGKPEVSAFAKAVEERVAISIAGMEPRTLSDPKQEAAIGSTIELAVETTEPGDAPLGDPHEGVGIPLFSEMSPDEVTAVLERLAVRKFPIGALVCEEGDLGRSMFILSEGIVEVFAKNPDGSRLVLGKLSGGDFFGEFGLLTNGTRNASVQATTAVELLEITSADFDVIASKFPRIWNILEEHVRSRMISNIFAKSPVFQVLTPIEKQKLATLLSTRKVQPGEVVTAQDTEGDEMFFIRSGSLAVTYEREQKKILIGELKAGDYFGEVALLTGKPRTASVTAKTPVELFRLTRKDAAQVLRDNREVLQLLKVRMDERAKDTRDAFQSFMEARTTLGLV
jgi:cAMP-dependent protein kinase regulator